MSTDSPTQTSSTRAPAVSLIDAHALATAAAIVSAAVMLVLGVFGAVGIYEGAVEMMMRWHLFFSPTVIGTVTGMVEAAVVSYAFVYAVGRIYNAML